MLLVWALGMAVAVGAYGQGSTDDVAEDVRKSMKREGWKSFKIGNVQMDYPKEWELDESGQMMTTFILFADVDDESDLFKENINLIQQDLAEYDMQGMTLKQYVDLTLAQLPAYMQNYALIGQREETRNGLTYHELVYKGEQGSFTLQFKQRLYLINDVAYILTFTAEEERYSAYDKLSGDILNAFTIAQ